MAYHIFNKLRMNLTHHYLNEGDLMCVSSIQIKPKEIQAAPWIYLSNSKTELASLKQRPATEPEG